MFKVDKEKCIGCGACQAICEEVFEITDDGYATAKNEEIKSDMRLIERKHLNGSYKFEHINNHIKYE